MRNDSDKRCRENQKTHLMFNNLFPKFVPFMRKCGKIMVDPDRSQMAVWRLQTSCFMITVT